MTPSLQKRSLLTPRATRKCFQVKIMTKIYRQKKRNFLKPRGQEKKIFMTKKKLIFMTPSLLNKKFVDPKGQQKNVFKLK